MEKALLVRFGGLGDLLVALPSIRLVRGKYPEARLTLACRREYGELLRATGVVDDVVTEDSRLLTPLFLERREEGAGLSDWLRSFDLIMGWTRGLKRQFPNAGTSERAQSPKIRFIDADTKTSGQLSLFFFRKTAQAIGENETISIDEWARLPVGRLQKSPAQKRSEGGPGINPNVVVHPGSGSESKRWPLANFLRIIKALGERSIAGVLVTGEAEEKTEAELEKTALPRGWNWLRCPSLPSLAVILSEAALYVGNDSGVTHLAAACGADIIALFRRDLTEAWRPLGRVELHIAASLDEIRFESVWKTVISGLPNFSAYSQKP
jgi:lipopolysaccharide heptosyltransferase III